MRNLLYLEFEAPEDTVGWGCVVCEAPPRGAIAIICDQCGENFEFMNLRFIAGGKFLTDKVRVPLAGYARTTFGHNVSRHPEIKTN